jgi:hypothetical protein
MKVRKWYSGLGIKIPIQSKRQRLLKNKAVIELLRECHVSGWYHESFEQFLKSQQ